MARVEKQVSERGPADQGHIARRGWPQPAPELCLAGVPGVREKLLRDFSVACIPPFAVMTFSFPR